MKLTKNNFSKKPARKQLFLSFKWLKPFGLVIWFGIFEDEADLKIPSDIFPSL